MANLDKTTTALDGPVGAAATNRKCWDTIRQEYVSGNITVKEIAAKHAVSVTRIYQVAKSNGWPKRGATRQNSSRFSAKNTQTHASPKEVLIKRFFAVLDHQTCELEQRFNEHAGSLPPSSEAERDARTLGALTKLLEKLIELEQSSTADEQSTVGDDPASADMDAFREELTRKLEELQRRDSH